MTDWRKAKLTRFATVGGRCEVCGDFLEERKAIGHHVVNRCQGGPDTTDNVEIRCAPCESLCHATYPKGNVPDSERFSFQLLILTEREKADSRKYERHCRQTLRHALARR